MTAVWLPRWRSFFIALIATACIFTIMIEAENSPQGRKSARLDDVGRPRIRPVGENTALSFKATDEFIAMLDKAAETLTRERPPGSSKVSRTEAIKILLSEALAARSKPRP